MLLKEPDEKRLQHVELGMRFKENHEPAICDIPIDDSVREPLRDMIKQTYSTWASLAEIESEYDPANDHAATERLWLPLNSPYVSDEIKNILSAGVADQIKNPLQDLNALSCYFGRFSPDRGSDQTLFAFRRASSFRGTVKRRSIFISWVDDSLKRIPDHTFKLDDDFDFYVDGDAILILRARAFESIAAVSDVVLSRAPKNVKLIQSSIKFVEMSSIAEHAQTHMRIARMLAAIAARTDLKKVSQVHLRRHCKVAGVKLATKNGKIIPVDGQEEAFLRVLDRRRYTVELIDQAPEIYDATNRKRAPK